MPTSEKDTLIERLTVSMDDHRCLPMSKQDLQRLIAAAFDEAATVHQQRIHAYEAQLEAKEASLAEAASQTRKQRTEVKRLRGLLAKVSTFIREAIDDAVEEH